MKFITLHLAYLITLHLSTNASATKSEINTYLEVTKGTIDKAEDAFKLALELAWIKPKGDGYIVAVAGARALSFGHWRLLEPSLKEATVLTGWGLKEFLLDKSSYQTRPKVIDLFAGVGGLSLGFESAGFEIVAAMDNDSHACEAHRKNFPNTTVIQDDINKFAKNPKQFLEGFGITGDIDGVIGGPPCQGFSYMGERVVDDDRNFLTTRFTDIVNGLKPKFFMMENVAGLKTIGIRPALEKYLIDLGKPIGAFAGELVANLPEVSKTYAKRGPQFKKRLISTAVSSFKSYGALQLLSAYDAKSCLQFIKKSPKLFKDAFANACEAECPEIARDADWMKAAAVTLAGNDQAIGLIGLGVFCEYRKNSDLANWDEFLDELVELAKKTTFSKALQEVRANYQRQPTAKKFQGESIGPILAGIINRVKGSYDIYGPKVLNSYKYGAPQSRQRLFLIGIRRDVKNTFAFPEHLFGLPDKKESSDLPPAPTCEDALSDLPDIDSFQHLIDSDRFSAEYLLEPDNLYAEHMRLYSLSRDDWSLPRVTWNPLIVDCCTRTIHSSEVVSRLQQTSQGIQDKKSGKTRLKRDGVSHTLRAGTKEEKGSHTAVRPVHYEHHRVISVREGARLMGFPDWMTFHPTKWHGFRLVGNAVPFQLGQSVAYSIKKILEE
jgi:DNA (cytosine-5)-methyltransferase 1